jgi:hypothetical protein
LKTFYPQEEMVETRDPNAIDMKILGLNGNS